MINIETLLLVVFVVGAFLSVISCFVFIPQIFNGVTIIYSYADIKKLWKENDIFPIANLILFVFFVVMVFLAGFYYFM